MPKTPAPPETLQEALQEELPDDELTEDEEAALEAEEKHRHTRFARGCLEVAVFMLVLAGAFTLLELKANISVLYILPPHILPLACMATSLLALMVGLFGIRRNAFAMMVMVLSGWMVLFVYAMIYLQEPETIHKAVPGTDKNVVLTLVSTLGSATLYIDEPIVENVVSYHWKLPVHDKNMPLDDLVVLELQESGEVHLLFDERLWAVYDPETNVWADVLHHEESEQTETEEETESQ
ncbi:MAG: hypothetical protein K2I93_08640 [Oscillospiraceae bacterium]|nr:hypothetical protein [Oscillospiraceae bacterium]